MEKNTENQTGTWMISCSAGTRDVSSSFLSCYCVWFLSIRFLRTTGECMDLVFKSGGGGGDPRSGLGVRGWGIRLDPHTYS